MISSAERELLCALCSPYEGGADPRSGGAPNPLSNADIAERLHLTEDGVRQRLKRLYPKFALSGSGPSKRRELAARAIESGAVGTVEG
jgi:DNA-binding CsgD family transcriptional regulator